MERLKALLDAGFRVGMVNYVMDASQKDRFLKLRPRFAALGVALHPNPLWDSKGAYSEADLDLMRETLPEEDFAYRSQHTSSMGKDCLFPAVGYEMDCRGMIHVGCYNRVADSFFNRQLPRRFAGPVPCPIRTCVALDMYSFLGEINRNTSMNTFAIYSDLLKEHAKKRFVQQLPVLPPGLQ
jgi:hypothetical protein